MKTKTDLHTHTSFSDGKATPEQNVQAALNLGLRVFGCSDHSHTDFDLSYCMKKEQYPAYLREMQRLQKAYEGKIRVLCGIEQDYYSNPTDLPFDYKIGSVHYLYRNGEYMAVDSAPSPKQGGIYLHKMADKLFGGDIYSLIECYFETVGNVIEKTGADIIGHFDLISKFNQNGDCFDERNPRYIKAGTDAIDKLLITGKPFEINTGAISRGYKTAPYPGSYFMAYIAEHDGRFVFSSDSHSPQNICYHFDELEKLPGIQIADLF